LTPTGTCREAEERQLWHRYGLDHDINDRSVGCDRQGCDARARGGPDASGPTTDDAMTCSEEELRVGANQQKRGRVRLRRYITTQ
jgi:hypothetical protein